MIEMLRASVRIVIFIFWLYNCQKISLAFEIPVVSNNLLDNSVSKPADDSEDLLAQPIHLKISLKHHRLTLYKGYHAIKSYPVAVGRRGWETPIGNFQVLQMLKNPTWINPLTDESIPGGDPKNPLGHYWIEFWTDGKNSIGLHGTPNPETVGKTISHGCVRMYNKDVEELFHKVSVGTPVIVVR